MESGLQDLKEEDDTKSLEMGMNGLELDTNLKKPGEPSHSTLTGVPTSRSRLAVDLGQPVSLVDPWTPISSRTINIWIKEVNKSQTYPETIYTHPSQGVIRNIGLALPSPKADSWGYKSALTKLVSALKPQMEEEGCSLIVRPATSSHLDLLVKSKNEDNQDISIDIDIALEKLAGPEDKVSSRKLLIPILLLLLCTFPNLQPALPDPTSEAKPNLNANFEADADAERVVDAKLDKGGISTVLLSLVALWPDGNPPRAALKRVNEILLGSGKH